MTCQHKPKEEPLQYCYAVDLKDTLRRYPGKFIPPETEDGRAVASFLLDCMHQHLQQKENP